MYRQLFDPASSTYSYLIDDAGHAVLIDPVREQAERDIKLLKELGLTLDWVIETHVHADHISAGGWLREALGCRVAVAAGAPVPCADRELADEEVLSVGQHRLTVLSTPGHTAQHIAILLDDLAVFTGDCLLIRGCGRTDFQGGDAGAQYDSLQRLLALPETTLVCPGHDYRGHAVSTIAEERRHNPRLAGQTRDGFITLMAGLKLPEPRLIHEAVPANLRCGRSQGEAALP
ncbi:MBL fold metallo-hydrolase [Parachitinimonas caeni]|uniref:MBL fold metallo-hydrolase n=1 Tax=Parachitinimonas caeni TaxID=3031301 RepID=A0ABT7DUE1_9NEIS|nr:MBL fold metallo-hydrolase [Parachitinimonas caeni]MDK2123707.1 MBL fold metallo-hydrolase [Parachitinimonas caeni]